MAEMPQWRKETIRGSKTTSTPEKSGEKCGMLGVCLFAVDKMKMGDRAPVNRDPVLHFDALRLVALREGDKTEEILAKENENKCLYAHLFTYTQPKQFFAAGAGLQPTPSPLCELA